MSHIPSSAMPHAKAHEPDAPPSEPTPAAASVKARPFPWLALALAIGGALAAGTAITATALLRKPAKRRAGRKPAAGKRPANTAAKPHRKQTDAEPGA